MGELTSVLQKFLEDDAPSFRSFEPLIEMSPPLDRAARDVLGWRGSAVRRSSQLETGDVVSIAWTKVFLALAGRGGPENSDSPKNAPPATSDEFFRYARAVLGPVVHDALRREGADKRGGHVEKVSVDAVGPDSAVAPETPESASTAAEFVDQLLSVIDDPRDRRIAELRLLEETKFEDIAAQVSDEFGRSIGARGVSKAFQERLQPQLVTAARRMGYDMASTSRALDRG